MRKKKILLVNEAHYLSTGYSRIGANILSYLHNTGKYELAELGCYGKPGDPRAFGCPWRFYPNLPDERNQDEINAYASNININQFGEWKFEGVALDFKPDILMSLRDHWMDACIINSPFRRMYHFAWMPTCDSISQNEDWIHDFSQADGVFTYTDWSHKVLEEEGGGQIKLLGPATPGVDLNIYAPVKNKRQHKAMFGLREDSLIVGTVMRNQKRKLYPDLLDSFAQLLQSISSELADRLFLYVHASYPDLGWDFPRLIKKYGLSSKILFTYLCLQCGCVFPRFYSDVRTVCPKCKGSNVTFPNTQNGVDEKVLSSIYNLFDVYVQFANSEGLGIPMVEAAACGVPIMATDYSAMSDAVRKLNGYPLKVLHLLNEAETGCYRAVPDNSDLVEKLQSFFKLPEMMRSVKGNAARQGAEKHFAWSISCSKWEQHFDSIPLRDLSTTWLSPPKIIPPINGFPGPDQLTDEQFVNWALVNVLGRPDLIGSYFAMKMIRDLMWGSTSDNMGGGVFNDLSLVMSYKVNYQPFNREVLVKKFTEAANKNNQWEQIRWQNVQSL